MSACAGEELSAGGKRTGSSLRPFIDRHEYHQLPVVFFLLVAPSLSYLLSPSASQSHATITPGWPSGIATMAIEYLGLSAVGWHVMSKRWWNLV